LSIASDIGYSSSEAIEGLIATQVKLEIKIRMDKLNERCSTYPSTARLVPEIKGYLSPWESASRERNFNTAVEKMEGVAGTDLAARVTKAAETALLEEFHKGIDEQMRGYMK
jgi:hypothetical protein